jgi:endo-1,4-beta-xylanase
MKFEFTEPEQNVFNFTGGQVAVDIGEDHGKYLRCHNLVWLSQLSDWVLNGTWTAETLTAVMKVHIQTLITHWGDACYSWDVVNEALAENGSFASSIWVSRNGVLVISLTRHIVRHHRARIFLPRLPVCAGGRRCHWERY